MEFFQALLTNSLLFHALLAGLLASVVSGIIGSYVVVKRIVFISGSISHSVIGGIGLFLWLERAQGWVGLQPVYGALLAAILSALIMGYIHIYYQEREDTVIAAVWSVGMAMGVLFISQTPGYNVELTSFFIGNILWVSTQDLNFLLFLDLLVLLTVYLLHPRLLVICFDEEQAALQGVNVKGLYLLLLALTSITIVLLIQVVGVILVMTLLAIPAAIGNRFSSRLSRVMLLATLFSLLFSVGGMVLSFYMDWPSGATIALLAGIGYILSLLTSRYSPGSSPPR